MFRHIVVPVFCGVGIGLVTGYVMKVLGAPMTAALIMAGIATLFTTIAVGSLSFGGGDE